MHQMRCLFIVLLMFAALAVARSGDTHLSPLSAKNAGQTGLNRTTHAVSSTSIWYAFAGQVTASSAIFCTIPVSSEPSALLYGSSDGWCLWAFSPLSRFASMNWPVQSRYSAISLREGSDALHEVRDGKLRRQEVLLDYAPEVPMLYRLVVRHADPSRYSAN